jgi:hypothetical protein
VLEGYRTEDTAQGSPILESPDESCEH